MGWFGWHRILNNFGRGCHGPHHAPHAQPVPLTGKPRPVSFPFALPRLRNHPGLSGLPLPACPGSDRSCHFVLSGYNPFLSLGLANTEYFLKECYQETKRKADSRKGKSVGEEGWLSAARFSPPRSHPPAQTGQVGVVWAALFLGPAFSASKGEWPPVEPQGFGG